MKENRKLAVWTLICTLCAGMLTGCGFFGKGFNNLSGQNAWKKTLKAYQAFLEDKVPDNEIYGDMIFPDKSGNLMLAVLYVDDARNGFDNPHFDLFGYEDGEVKRIEAFDPEEDAEENGGKILDTIFTDGIIRVRECDRDGYFSTVYYQIDQNEPVPFYTTHYMDTDQYYEVTIGNGKGAETFLVGSDRNDENRYPDEYDRAMEDFYKEIYDGRYAWDDFAKYMRDEVYYIPNYSHVIAFLDDEGVYDFEGHGDAWFLEMDENGVLTDFEKDMS
ncbi:MAG: hypothetical protein K5649_06005 [Lachnospiraceae bacterium]|nr:hypothetical protein [Lachnospiraceae bacterium]